MTDSTNQDDDHDRDETVLEIYSRLIAGNPRFVEAKPSGEAITILGARPPGTGPDTRPEFTKKTPPA
jgi:hypothetical protein